MAGDGRRDVIIDHPNRRLPVVRATKAAVIVLLLVSAALMLVVTAGGWATLEGMRGLLVAWTAVYLVLAYLCARWMRGTLPLAAALGILLLIFAAIAGPEWFARDHRGFAQPALDSGLLGIVTLLLVPVQFLLIAFAMRGFRQDWHVEVEHRRPATA